ncbi:MAG TPA: hypothetical protein VGZ73_20950 [Bryobacteraceae bacterium]|nr:hypothetical protein [Bryobacteraceae bacterium]
MQQTIGNMMKIGGLAVTAAVMGITLGTPAMACSKGGSAVTGAALSARMASLRNLGLVEPPKIGGRDKADTAKEAQPQAADPLNPSIIGLWQVVELDNGQPVGLSFEVWHSDGTEILIDQSNPATDNVCIGTWQQTGSLVFKLTHPSLNFDTSGNYIGTVMINEVVTLDRNGNKFSATYTADVFDVNGLPVPDGHFEGQLVGKKINPPV